MKTHKADALAQLAIKHGWKSEVVPKFELYEVSGDLNDIVWHFYAKRNYETIHVPWRGNHMEPGKYTYGDFHLKIWWRNELVKLIKGQPDPLKFRNSPEDLVPNIPWEDDAPAFEIMKAVINRKVIYERKIDGAICEDRVDVNLKEPASAKHFRIYSTKSGRRVLEWADAHGFHAIGLDQIVKVA